MKWCSILGIILSVFSDACLASTADGNFIINNHSSFIMNRIDMQSNQMNKWDFSQTIPASQSITSPIEFEWLWFTSHLAQNDSGTVSYQINCPSGGQILKINAGVIRKLPYAVYISDFAAYFTIQSNGAECVKTDMSPNNVLLPDVGSVNLNVFNSN